MALDQEELSNKLAQIEEQATYTLAEFPKTLTKERLRMIVALTRYIRTELQHPRETGFAGERGAHPSVDDGVLRSA